MAIVITYSNHCRHLSLTVRQLLSLSLQLILFFDRVTKTVILVTMIVTPRDNERDHVIKKMAYLCDRDTKSP